MTRALLSAHALTRYHERVKPALDPYAASADLMRLVATVGVLRGEAPAWITEPQDLRWPAEMWLVIGEDIAFPVTAGVALTCVTRAGFSEGARDHVNRAKRRAKGAKRRVGGDSHAWRRERKGQRAAGRRFDPEEAA